MRAASRNALALITMLAVPMIVIGTTTIALFQPWIVDAVYSTPGFPEDRFGMPEDARAELAKVGVRAVAPLGPGADSLAEAQLPDTSPAYSPLEIAHMRDVRNLVLLITAAWLTSVVIASVAIATLHRAGLGDTSRKAIERGALLTIVALVALGPAMLLNFDGLFTGFHELFFEEGTWTFSRESTLIRLYPERFWSIAAIFAAAISILIAAGVWRAAAAGTRDRTAQAQVR